MPRPERGTARRVLARSAVLALAEFGAMYTWRTWLFGWLLRVLAQVGFFALIGRLLDDPEAVAYLLVGQAVMIAVIEALLVVPSTTWERRAGTLPLLVAAPANPALVFLGRSVQWLASGVASATVALFTMSAVFGVALPWPRALLAVPLIAVVAASTYCFGTVLAAVVLRFMETRNVVLNVAYLTLMAVCGVGVPTAFWPRWIEVAAQGLPLTHGLLAIRALLDGADASVIWAGAGREMLVGAVWLAVSLLAFRHLAESGRRDGSIEFAA